MYLLSFHLRLIIFKILVVVHLEAEVWDISEISTQPCCGLYANNKNKDRNEDNEKEDYEGSVD